MNATGVAERPNTTATGRNFTHVVAEQE